MLDTEITQCSPAEATNNLWKRVLTLKQHSYTLVSKADTYEVDMFPLSYETNSFTPNGVVILNGCPDSINLSLLADVSFHLPHLES